MIRHCFFIIYKSVLNFAFSLETKTFNVQKKFKKKRYDMLVSCNFKCIKNLLKKNCNFLFKLDYFLVHYKTLKYEEFIVKHPV